MIHAQLSRAQNELLEVIRFLSLKGVGPTGWPSILPMWRVEDGIEADDETDELRAVRVGLVSLRQRDQAAYELVLAATGRPVGELDWMTLAAALDELDAAVEAALA